MGHAARDVYNWRSGVQGGGWGGGGGSDPNGIEAAPPLALESQKWL